MKLAGVVMKLAGAGLGESEQTASEFSLSLGGLVSSESVSSELDVVFAVLRVS
jgi:hypothetical protein